MPINQSLWDISSGIELVSEASLDFERELEELLEKKIEILNDNWMIIGRQVITKYGKKIDLLAIDSSGSIIILELKKDKTSRDVVAQSIDYATWIRSLRAEEVSDIFIKYSQTYLNKKTDLKDAFKERFKFSIEESEINSSHQIVVVSSSIDPSTERMINYLSDSNIPINVAFFKVFKIVDKKILSRAWLLDPFETTEIATTRGEDGPWNGEYYFSFGESSTRSWQDAVKYGFVCAGGGLWYSRTLNILSENDRIWVNIPKTGYVGVGIVKAPAQLANDSIFQVNGKNIPFYSLDLHGDYHVQNKDDEEKSEYIVRVEWIKTIKIDDAVSEYGFFGNQNTVCKPTTSKWNFTIERLKAIWKIE